MRWLGEAYPGLDHMRNPAGFSLLDGAGRSAAPGTIFNRKVKVLSCHA